MKRIILTRNWAAAGVAALAASALAILPVHADQTATQKRSSSASQSGSISSADRSFVRQAAEGGMAEVRMGEIGQQKASNAEVKALAKRLQNDHQQANSELKSFAQSKGIELPTSMGSTQEQSISGLEDKQGADFDREFVQHAIQDHQKDIAEFEKASSSATDPDLKAWAEKTLPVLKEHLQLAQKASQSLENESGNMRR